MTEERGIYMTSRTIATLVGVATLVGITFTGVTTINGYAFRIQKLESERAELVTTVQTLTAKIEELNKQIVSLTITINRLEERYSRLETPSNTARR